MYHPLVTAAAIKKLEESFRPRSLRVYSVAECEEMTSKLADAQKKGVTTRGLTAEEQAFIVNESILTKADFRYWAERYCFINVEGTVVDRLCPLWESQELILAKLAELEFEAFEGSDTQLLINLLKARQLGGSTLAESLAAHRATTQVNINGLIASDVPGQAGSGYLFGMFERVVDYLPWFLQPKITDRVKDTEIGFEGGTRVWVEAGKSMKGTEGKRGQIGRGKTISLMHLSELSTWEDPGQIDDALMPTVPLNNPRVLGVCESTAKGRNNWWHKHWNKSVAGVGRFTPVFIPWYAEPSKYRKRPGEGWEPLASTLAHSEKVRRESPKWCGKQVELTRDQAYWYETTRAEYEADGNISAFLEEYAADPEEAFQFSGHSIFTPQIQQRIQDQMRPLSMVMEVVANRERM